MADNKWHYHDWYTVARTHVEFETVKLLTLETNKGQIHKLVPNKIIGKLEYEFANNCLRYLIHTGTLEKLQDADIFYECEDKLYKFVGCNGDLAIISAKAVRYEIPFADIAYKEFELKTALKW